jgi:hypothetical protein
MWCCHIVCFLSLRLKAHMDLWQNGRYTFILPDWYKQLVCQDTCLYFPLYKEWSLFFYLCKTAFLYSIHLTQKASFKGSYFQNGFRRWHWKHAPVKRCNPLSGSDEQHNSWAIIYCTHKIFRFQRLTGDSDEPSSCTEETHFDPFPEGTDCLVAWCRFVLLPFSIGVGCVIRAKEKIRRVQFLSWHFACLCCCANLVSIWHQPKRCFPCINVPAWLSPVTWCNCYFNIYLFRSYWSPYYEDLCLIVVNVHFICSSIY